MTLTDAPRTLRIVMGEAERKARAELRRGRALIRRTHLGDASDPSPVRGEDAVSLVAVLTRESWALAGLVTPDYARCDIPWRFVPGFPP